MSHSALQSKSAQRLHYGNSHRARAPFSVVCRASQQPSRAETVAAAARKIMTAGSAASLSFLLLATQPAVAELSRFEYDAGGEFGNGSAQQYGEADVDGKDFSGQDLRRSNFTSASARRTNFKGANLQGAYFIKAVTFRANFEDANLADTLMDRATLNESNFKNAILARAILTRSDLTGADIEGADFTNALVDRSQQLALCKYADGVNAVTGESTRKSLGCGSMRRFRNSTPSNPDGPAVSESEKDAFRATIPSYRQ